MNMNDHLTKAIAHLAARQEAELREMLGRWVSELEPCMVIDRRSGEILGLTFSGCIFDRPPIVVSNTPA